MTILCVSLQSTDKNVSRTGHFKFIKQGISDRRKDGRVFFVIVLVFRHEEGAGDKKTKRSVIFHQAASKMLIQRPFSSPFLLIIDLHRSQPLDLFVKVYMLSFAF